jgi:hypothetical protein
MSSAVCCAQDKLGGEQGYQSSENCHYGRFHFHTFHWMKRRTKLPNLRETPFREFLDSECLFRLFVIDAFDHHDAASF